MLRASCCSPVPVPTVNFQRQAFNVPAGPLVSSACCAVAAFGVEHSLRSTAAARLTGTARTIVRMSSADVLSVRPRTCTGSNQRLARLQAP
jgi:hypothetical protein